MFASFISFRSRIYLTCRATAISDPPPFSTPPSRIPHSTTLAYFSTTVAVVPGNTAHRALSLFSNIYVFVLARSHHYFLLY